MFISLLFQQSEIIVVPGNACFLIIGIRVSALLSTTLARKQILESLSMPPNTQTPSFLFPLSYFLLPNLLSSISTIFPGPPTLPFSFSKIPNRPLDRDCTSQPVFLHSLFSTRVVPYPALSCTPSSTLV